MRRTMSRLFRSLFLVAAMGTFAAAGPQPPPNKVWVGSWAAAQQLPEPDNSLPAADLSDATLRQVVHLSIGGTQLRLTLSNAFGTAPLHIASAHIALATAAGGIDPATDRALGFSGSPETTIPAGASYRSDPIAFPAAAQSDLAITLYFDTPPALQTGHPGSRATSYLVHGNLVSATQLPDAKKITHWYQIAGVEVTAPAKAGTVVMLGDSITDGRGATTDGNDRWPDVLARRFEADPATKDLGVLNLGIGGNRLLLDGLGPNALARFDRDVLAQPGVRYLIVFEGVNDLGMLTRDHPATLDEHVALVRRILAAYEQIAARAHAHGINVFGATITPFMGFDYYHPDADNEADHEEVDAWIRIQSQFDAVIDFDKVVRDPAHPERLNPAYDSGDHLHPSPAGYRAMAEAIPLALFGAPVRAHRRPKR
jgi:lysophospholipase L1-like esterase